MIVGMGFIGKLVATGATAITSYAVGSDLGIVDFFNDLLINDDTLMLYKMEYIDSGDAYMTNMSTGRVEAIDNDWVIQQAVDGDIKSGDIITIRFQDAKRN